MNQRVAVEPNLTPVKELLSSKGYQVDSMNVSGNTSMAAGNYDAYIVTGMNSNFMGMGNTSSKALVIDATGLTAEQVYQELQSRLG